jgi:hypothetical protein
MQLKQLQVVRYSVAKVLYHLLLMFVALNIACKDSTTTPEPDVFQLLKISTDEVTLSANRLNTGISPEAIFKIEFTSSIDTNTVKKGILLTQDDSQVALQFEYEDNAATVSVKPATNLSYTSRYSLTLTDALNSEDGAVYAGSVFNFETANGSFRVTSSTVNQQTFTSTIRPTNISYDEATIEVQFDSQLEETTFESHFSIVPNVSYDISLSPDQSAVIIELTEQLNSYQFYTLLVSSSLTDVNDFDFESYTATFQAGVNSTPKFPQISDDELLTKIQHQTFKYFWDFGHPVSGLSRERNSSGETVTIGGSGFGIMSIIVGIERGFITREEGINRLSKIVNFLQDDADRFHGAWSHWLHGSTGDAIAFSSKDDGADLVETAFMAQGLITVREYLNEEDAAENTIHANINTLLSEIEWNWFTRDAEDVLYWHWSPNYGWDMNMRISGYNEALIVYVLAASSSSFGIDADVYHKGWARSGNIRNGNLFYGIELPVGFDFGGPLFFAHYSFLGLNPTGLTDAYADYWTQNRNHTLINRQHSIENPRNYMGYNAESWGLTASDEPGGYSAHEPSRDNGTITPTAAISSIPYTPEESMEAIRHFYYDLGDKLWGEYGFYDAFNPTENWWANSYLAIDQGPIIIMIENHRTGLLWDLFMQAPEVQSALNKLGFSINK